MKDKAILDYDILNRMFLNREFRYVEGYINIYCEKNENRLFVEKSMIFENYISLSNQFQKNWDNFIEDIEYNDMRFVKMKNKISSIKENYIHYSQNIDENSKIKINNTNLMIEENNKESKNNDNDIVDYLNGIENDKISNINNSEKSDFYDEDSFEFQTDFNILLCYSDQIILDFNSPENDINNSSIDLKENEEENEKEKEKEKEKENEEEKEKENEEEKEKIHEFIMVDNADTQENDKLNNEKQKEERKENEISFVFIYKNDEKILKEKSDEKFSEILSKFLKAYKDNNCYVAINLSNFNLINKKETLVRNNIKNNDQIRLYCKSEKGKNLNLKEDSEILYNLLNIYQAKLFSLSEKKMELNEALIKNSKIHPKLNEKINPKEMIRFLMNIAEDIHPGIKKIGT